MKLIFDQIGYWTEVKHAIISDYGSAYSKILSTRTNPPFHHVYIDAFAGPGTHFSKDKQEFVPGSPTIALSISPPFREYFFIDISTAKISELRKITEGITNVHILEGDCNDKLLSDVFPLVKYEEYRRGLCLLDPYGLHLNWDVIKTAGQMKSIDMFLNFPVADMNRNVLWNNPQNVDPADIQRMNAFWGDESWRDVTYSIVDLFGEKHKSDNETVAVAFRDRLKRVAEFQYVSNPMPMRNSKNAIVYYLFFASQQKVADDIINDIFAKYKNRHS
jgi:three-Cys-motif partner protein